MQVILLEKLAKLGQLGDIVKVKDGYARNYLIPQGKARRATEAALKEFEGRRGELERAHSDRLQAAQSLVACQVAFGPSVKDPFQATAPARKDPFKTL